MSSGVVKIVSYYHTDRSYADGDTGFLICGAPSDRSNNG
jgi:hypothetical protein